MTDDRTWGRPWPFPGVPPPSLPKEIPMSEILINGRNLQQTLDQIDYDTEATITREVLRAREAHPIKKEAARKMFEVTQRLREAGFRFEPYGYSSGYLDVELKDLQRLHKILGPMRIAHKAVKD